MLRWQLNTQNTIRFVMVNTSNVEVTGLGSGFTLQLAKSDESAFTGSAGTKSEMTNGWYQYISSAAEADTPGEIAIKVTGAGAVQQNLVYQVGDSKAGYGPITHTVTVEVSGVPIDGADVWITSDAAGSAQIAGVLQTNSEGNATFYLNGGTYYVWVQHGQHNFTNPTEITVS